MRTVLLVLLAWPVVTAHDHRRPPSLIGPDDSKIKFFEERVKANPLDSLSLGRLGALYLVRARRTAQHVHYRQAEETFRKLLRSIPEDRTGLTGLSYALAGQHRFSEALFHARMVGERHPDDPEVRLLLGDIHFALGNYLESDMFFGAVLRENRSPGTLSRMAQITEIRGDYDRTEMYYREALKAWKNSGAPENTAWCHSMLGDLYLTLGRFREARENLEKALVLAPHMDEAVRRLAQLALHQGKPEEAERLLHPIIHDLSGKPQFLFTYGTILQALGKTEKAAAAFQKAETEILGELALNDVGHIRELIHLWLHLGKDPNKISALAQKELKEIRHDFEAHELAAWSLHLAGRDKEALPHVAASLRNGISLPRTMLRAGIVQYAAGNAFQAVHLLRMGLVCEGITEPKLVKQAQQLVQHLNAHPEEIRHALTPPKPVVKNP